MKKILIIMLLVTMLLFIMTACGGTGSTKETGNGDPAANVGPSGADKGEDGNNVPADEGGNASDSGSSPAGNGAGGIYKTSGNELSDFSTSFTETETPYSDSISSLESPSMDTLSVTMAVMMPNLDLAMLAGYDILSVDDLPKEEGKLLLSDLEGVREKSGDKINFSASHTYDEDGNVNKKGDKVTEKGVLDTSKNELTFEFSTERGGKLINRTVMEAVILKDGTHLMQYFKVAEGYSEGSPATASAVFKRFSKDDYKGISAKFDPNYDFKYDSILGKGDIQPEAMAKNYTIEGTLTVAGGKVDFKK